MENVVLLVLPTLSVMGFNFDLHEEYHANGEP